MKNTVYLAGGFKSNWRENVKQLDGFIWLDPKEKERPKGVEEHPMSLCEYGTWDLHFIKQADIIFVYVERNNPSCIGLSVEVGFGCAHGKTVILVLEPNHETIKDGYLQFLKNCASITFETLQQGISYLRLFSIMGD